MINKNETNTNNNIQQQNSNLNYEMTVISSDNNRFTICDGGVKIYNQLPIGIYKIDYSDKGGFALTRCKDFFLNEHKIKIYGNYMEKIDKIIHIYTNINKNLGVIFTGSKGLGKTLISKILCLKVLHLGYPCIIVDGYKNGIVDFISSIKQSCVLLFDEFDKNFSTRNAFSSLTSDRNTFEENDHDSNQYSAAYSSQDIQQEFLSLFDGLDTGHRLFIVTCNSLKNMNKFFINRPGRFHFNIQFYYPTVDDVAEYLDDNVLEQYKNQIEDVLQFAGKVNLNYDSLRAIVFEINLGYKFKDFIKDLNIVKTTPDHFRIKAKINGKIYTNILRQFDLLSSHTYCVNLLSEEDSTLDNRNNNVFIKEADTLELIFNTKDIKVRKDLRDSFYINPKDVMILDPVEQHHANRARNATSPISSIIPFPGPNNKLASSKDDSTTSNNYNIEWVEFVKINSSSEIRF